MNNNPMAMLMQLMSSKQNPNQLINQLLNQNPQANIMLNQMKQSGMSPKDFVLQYAKQNNIDMNSIIDLFNKNGIKL